MTEQLNPNGRPPAPPAFAKRLRRDEHHNAMVMADPGGELRYLYTDGTMDRHSTVSVEAARILVSGCAEKDEITEIQRQKMGEIIGNKVFDPKLRDAYLNHVNPPGIAAAA